MKEMMEDALTKECPLPSPLKARLGTVFFMAGLFFASFVTSAIFPPLMPEIEKDLGIGHGDAGIFFLMISLGYLLVPFIVGWLSSRITHRGALMVSIWLIAFSMLPVSFVKTLWILKIFMFLLGIGAGIHLPSAMATIAAEVQKSDWGKALSIHQSVGPLALIITPLVAALLISRLSWRGVILVWCVLIFILAIAYSIRGRGGSFHGRQLNLKLTKSVLVLPGFWIMLFLLAMGIGGNIGIYTMLPLFFVHERGMHLAQANIMIGLSLVSGLIAVFFTGWIIDKFGQKPTMICVLLIAATCTIMIGFTSGPLMLVLLFLQAGALAAFMPAAFAALAKVAPPYLRSVSTALCPPASYVLGAGLIPVSIGIISDNYSFAAGISLVGCFMQIGPVLLAFLKLGQFDDQPGC